MSFINSYCNIATMDEMRTIPLPFNKFWQSYTPPPPVTGLRKDLFMLETEIRETGAVLGVPPPGLQEYVLQKLSWLHQHGFGMHVTPVYGVFQTDGLVPPNILEVLKKGVGQLETSPEVQSEWIYTSNLSKQVLPLVDPALYCFVQGVSPTMNIAGGKSDARRHAHDCGGGGDDGFWIKYLSNELKLDPAVMETIIIQTDLTDPEVSNKFQLLPSDFYIDLETRQVRIGSYINNLHPIKYMSLYNVIGGIFELGLPLLETVLTDLLNVGARVYAEENLNNILEERAKGIYHLTYRPLPRPGKFVDLSGHKLQVIVALKSIHLTPDNPKYNGGYFHVEGMKNEQIIASMIYYFDVQNIRGSKLEFRVESGKSDDNPNLIPLGYINTSKSGRLICFPNIYQHYVKPFELADKTKVGHRKILVYFIVNPTLQIISTAQVPPQQASWYCSSATDTSAGTDDSQAAADDDDNFRPMSLETAMKFREELNEERAGKAFYRNGIDFKTRRSD